MKMIDKISAVFLLTAFIFSAAWYTDYLKSRNQWLADIMVCMGDDNSRAAYNRCFIETKRRF